MEAIHVWLECTSLLSHSEALYVINEFWVLTIAVLFKSMCYDPLTIYIRRWEKNDLRGRGRKDG